MSELLSSILQLPLQQLQVTEPDPYPSLPLTLPLTRTPTPTPTLTLTLTLTRWDHQTAKSCGGYGCLTRLMSFHATVGIGRGYDLAFT